MKIIRDVRTGEARVRFDYPQAAEADAPPGSFFYPEPEDGEEVVEVADATVDEFSAEADRVGKGKHGRVFVDGKGKILKVELADLSPNDLSRQLSEIMREAGKEPQDALTLADVEKVRDARREKARGR